MIKLKYKSWNDVPLNLYFEISDILNSDSLDDLEKNIKVASLLSDSTEDELWALDWKDMPTIMSELSWLWSFKFSKHNPGKKMKIKDRVFNISSDLERFTISQYIDFQNLWPKFKDDTENILPRLLCVFLVPEGRKYNTDYSLEELSRFFYTSMPITTANQILYFFLISLARSIRATEICYNLMMKILKRKAKTKEEKEKIETLRKETERMINQAQLIIGSL